MQKIIAQVLWGQKNSNLQHWQHTYLFFLFRYPSTLEWVDFEIFSSVMHMQVVRCPSYNMGKFDFIKIRKFNFPI